MVFLSGKTREGMYRLRNSISKDTKAGKYEACS